MAEEMRINIGDTVLIRFEENEEQHETKVQGVRDDLFYVPSWEEEEREPETKANMAITKPTCLWVFEAAYEGQMDDGEGNFFSVFRETTPIKRIQRRQAYRLQMTFEAEVILGGKREKVMCRDISETGLCFEYKRPLEQGSKVICLFALEKKDYKLLLEVRNALPTKDGRHYWIGCRFAQIKEQESKEIRNLIFKAQVRRGW